MIQFAKLVTCPAEITESPEFVLKTDCRFMTIETVRLAKLTKRTLMERVVHEISADLSSLGGEIFYEPNHHTPSYICIERETGLPDSVALPINSDGCSTIVVGNAVHPKELQA